MMKRFFFSVVLVAITVGAFAQTVQDGVKALYYQQNKKAKNIFEKAIAANPADVDANYWLGQLYIKDDNLAAAKELYAKALTTTAQNPLIVIGLGHVELLEGKNADARAHFDGALDPTKNKKNKNFGDVKLLAAIGRANADGGSDKGDPIYGIEKLDQAAQLDLKDPEIMISKGLCNLKRGGEYGGEAKKAFDAALDRDPNYALAYLRIGKIFQTQRSTELFLENYNKSVSVDAAFAPGYIALYDYYANRDVNKAKEYLDKYIANTEKDRETDYFYADYLLRAGKYDESMQKAKELEAGLNGEQFPKVHKLLAVNYERLGDSISAVNEMEKYVTTEAPSKITPDSYGDVAALFAKVPGKEAQADEYFGKAVASDTTVSGKAALINQASAIYAKAKNYRGQLKWLDMLSTIKPELSASDLFYWGAAAEGSGDYAKAMDIYKKYIAKYPEQFQGYAGQMRSAIKADADTTQGTALPAIDEYNNYLKKDTAKNKNRIKTNLSYKVFYYVMKAKDYSKGMDALQEILAVDPTDNYASEGIRSLKATMNRKPASNTPPAKNAKPSDKPKAKEKPGKK